MFYDWFRVGISHFFVLPDAKSRFLDKSDMMNSQVVGFSDVSSRKNRRGKKELTTAVNLCLLQSQFLLIND